MSARIEQVLLLVIVALLGSLTLWLQYGLEDQPEPAVPAHERHDPDYYIENFTATGMDENGNLRYRLEADRMVHYPDDNTALLDKPHLIQYESGREPTHSFAESGWVSPDGDEVLLTGNVRVIRGKDASGAGAAVMTSNKLKVKLKKGTMSKDS